MPTVPSNQLVIGRSALDIVVRPVSPYPIAHPSENEWISLREYYSNFNISFITLTPNHADPTNKRPSS
jgi:hypothetical protein